MKVKDQVTEQEYSIQEFLERASTLTGVKVEQREDGLIYDYDDQDAPMTLDTYITYLNGMGFELELV